MRSKLSGEARKSIFGSNYNNIGELIEKHKRVYAPAKSVYQLQAELVNTYMWKKENVLSYAARDKEIVDRIEDTHRLNNNGQVDNTFKHNLKETLFNASSALQRNRNSDYLKMHDTMNNRNNKTTRFNAA